MPKLVSTSTAGNHAQKEYSVSKKDHEYAREFVLDHDNSACVDATVKKSETRRKVRKNVPISKFFSPKKNGYLDRFAVHQPKILMKKSEKVYSCCTGPEPAYTQLPRKYLE